MGLISLSFPEQILPATGRDAFSTPLSLLDNVVFGHRDTSQEGGVRWHKVRGQARLAPSFASPITNETLYG